MKNGKAHFGGWYDTEASKIYLDMSTIVDNVADAEKLSRQYKQEAYFNLETFETIRVGARDATKPRPKKPAKIGADSV